MKAKATNTPIEYRDAVYLQHECIKLNIQVTICRMNDEISIRIMDHEFFEYIPALRFVQLYQAEQGRRWAAYKSKTAILEVVS